MKNKNRIIKWFDLLFRVSYIFIVGVGLLFIVIVLCDFVLNTNYWENIENLWDTKGFLVVIFSGITSVTWAIRDGQFLDDIKPSHWGSKENRKKREELGH